MPLFEDAFTVGITAVPTPIGDIGSDLWMLWMPFVHTMQRTGTGILAPSESKFVVDSKAMRKLLASERVVVILENENPSFGLRFHLSIRQLAMLKGTG